MLLNFVVLRFLIRLLRLSFSRRIFYFLFLNILSFLKSLYLFLISKRNHHWHCLLCNTKITEKHSTTVPPDDAYQMVLSSLLLLQIILIFSLISLQIQFYFIIFQISKSNNKFGDGCTLGFCIGNPMQGQPRVVKS